MIPQPTRHLRAGATIPITLAAGLYGLATLTGNPWFTLLTGGCAGLLLVSLAQRAPVTGLEFSLEGPARVAVGDVVRQRLGVHNTSSRAMPAHTVVPRVPGLPDVTVHVPALPPGGEAHVQLTRTADRRWTSPHALVLITPHTGLGLVRTELTRAVGQPFIVHPRLVDARPPRESRAPLDEAVDPVPGPGLDVAGVREWRPGDDPVRVHWRSSARRGRLVVLERGTAPADHVVVAMAAGSQAPDWEDAIAVAASTCRLAQRAGRQLTTLVWPDGTAPVAASARSVTGLLDWWSELRVSGRPHPARLVRDVWETGARDLSVVASEHTTEQWWIEVAAAAAAAGVRVTRLSVPA